MSLPSVSDYSVFVNHYFFLNLGVKVRKPEELLLPSRQFFKNIRKYFPAGEKPAKKLKGYVVNIRQGHHLDHHQDLQASRQDHRQHL